MENPKPKLKLNRETLRRLQDEVTKDVVGAQSEGQSVCNICPVGPPVKIKIKN